MFYRSCEYCKKFIHDSNGIVKGQDGEPIERPKNIPVVCSTCEKYDNETGEVWRCFTTRNRYLFKSFLIAHHFGVLPREGGIDQQDPRDMDKFVLLAELFRVQGVVDEREFQAKLVGVGFNRL